MNCLIIHGTGGALGKGLSDRLRGDFDLYLNISRTPDKVLSIQENYFELNSFCFDFDSLASILYYFNVKKIVYIAVSADTEYMKDTLYDEIVQIENNFLQHINIILFILKNRLTIELHFLGISSLSTATNVGQKNNYARSKDLFNALARYKSNNVIWSSLLLGPLTTSSNSQSLLNSCSLLKIITRNWLISSPTHVSGFIKNNILSSTGGVFIYPRFISIFVPLHRALRFCLKK